MTNELDSLRKKDSEILEIKQKKQTIELIEDFQLKEKKKRQVKAAKRQKAVEEQQAGKTLKE